jgi:Trp operon repressor
MPCMGDPIEDPEGWGPFLDMMKDAKRRDHERMVREALLPDGPSLLRASAQLRYRILRRLLHLPTQLPRKESPR